MPEQPTGEKILPPSPRKRERAREKGDVAKSQDLNAAGTLLAALLGLWLMGPLIMTRLMAVTRFYFTDPHLMLNNESNLQSLLAQVLLFMLPISLPFMMLLLVGGVLINVAQFGFLFAPQALTPKFQRINPLSGIQRFMSMRTLVELVKSITKLGVIGYIAWVSFRDRLDELVSLMHLGPLGGSIAVWDLILTVWWRIVIATLIIGLLDFLFQYFQKERELMMTRQEAQEEMRNIEGDPRIRQRVRQIQRQVAMQRMMGEVPTADVVVTNPLTYAIALRYDQGEMRAPIVVAKGARLLAERIRDVATEHDVPIVERPELARTLYQATEIGQAIPGNLFRTVAEVLAYVYQIDKRAEKRMQREEMNAAAVSA